MDKEKLALRGGKSIRISPFPAWPVLGNEDKKAVEEVLESGKLTCLTGQKVREFEDKFADYHGVKHAIAVSSGTSAIHIALAAARIGPGDEVVVPAHTFIGTVTPVLHQNAIPVFADIDLNTFNIKSESIGKVITEKTKAIIPVHLNGHPAEMDEIMEIAKEHKLIVIEDACQAHGAKYKGRKVGTIGDLGCFSFWEDKIITTGGEGGMIITNNDELAERARFIRHHGETETKKGEERKYYHSMLGYNYRMTEMQAAIGLVQFSKLDSYLEKRRENAAYLTEHLKKFAQIEPPLVKSYVKHSYYKYICRINKNKFEVPIEEFIKAVSVEGIPISRRYPIPIHLQPVFTEKKGYGNVHCPFACPLYGIQREYKKDLCPNAERLSDELFTLLVHPTVNQKDLDDIILAIEKVIKGLS